MQHDGFINKFNFGRHQLFIFSDILQAQQILIPMGASSTYRFSVSIINKRCNAIGRFVMKFNRVNFSKSLCSILKVQFIRGSKKNLDWVKFNSKFQAQDPKYFTFLISSKIQWIVMWITRVFLPSQYYLLNSSGKYSITTAKFSGNGSSYAIAQNFFGKFQGRKII